MINGLLTLRGAWDRVRESAVLKFMVVAITAYGMATFEGPMLSLKNVNAISHFTDWTIAHVHVGALGWNGFLTFGVLYWLVPRMWQTDLYSKKWANWHFWIGTLGILLYAIPMYWAGWMQSSMWKEFTPEGQLQYQFLETVQTMRPFYMARSLGGLLYLVGAIIMVVNLVKTAKQGVFLAEEKAEADNKKAEEQKEAEKKPSEKTQEKINGLKGSLFLLGARSHEDCRYGLSPRERGKTHVISKGGGVCL
jgi:cytochrome c oxidase cbb3-type subunit I/II